MQLKRRAIPKKVFDKKERFRADKEKNYTFKKYNFTRLPFAFILAAAFMITLHHIVDMALTTSKAGVVKLRKEIVFAKIKSFSATGTSLNIVGEI